MDWVFHSLEFKLCFIQKSEKLIIFKNSKFSINTILLNLGLMSGLKIMFFFFSFSNSSFFSKVDFYIVFLSWWKVVFDSFSILKSILGDI